MKLVRFDGGRTTADKSLHPILPRFIRIRVSRPDIVDSIGLKRARRAPMLA